MSTNINIGSNLKDYLSSRNEEKPSNALKTNITNILGVNKAKDWFYQPLSTEDTNSDSNQLNTDLDDRKTSTKGWFPSFGILSNTQKESNDWFPSLSRTQRIIGFIVCLLMGFLCFSLSSFLLPVLIFKARKFAILFTFGSLFIIMSFSILWGPMSHLKHLFSKERLPFTLTYFGSLFGTLYFALKIQNTLLTTIFAVIQVIALIWYVVSYLPGGQTGLMFFSKVVTKAAAKSLPV